MIEDIVHATGRIPAYIVTGFLGAGKTTLLRRLIENATDKRFAVVINEFGDMGFDGELIEACCQDVVELKNGCICCRVGDDLVPTLEAVIERDTPPDAILIETSGLALPQPVVDAFRFPTIARRAAVSGVVVVVDAPIMASGTFEEVLTGLRSAPTLATPKRPSVLHGGTDGEDDPIAEVFEDQLRAADLVILSKIDQLSSERVATVTDGMRSSLPIDVPLAAAVHGEMDAATILSLGADGAGTTMRPSRHALEPDHDHDDFEGLVLDLEPAESRAALEARIARMVAGHGLLRVKGFAAIQGRPQRFVVQSTPSGTTTTADRIWLPDESPQTRLVVIGRKGLIPATLAAALAEPSMDGNAQ